MRLGSLVLLVSICVSVAGQECRLTPLSPAQPPLKMLEGEKSTESETFQTGQTAVSPQKQVYFFDTTSRIRRITADGRMETVAGNGIRAERVVVGDARANGLPAVGQLVFSRDGVLHFSATGQIFRVVNGRIELVAGSGRPGFNVEEGNPQDVNLGSITHFVFSFRNELMLVDGYARVRRLESDGVLRTVVGSTRIAAANGLTGDGGPATQAALSNPRQVIPFADGTYWVRDLGGRNIRVVTTDGVIRTVNQAFDTAVTILQFPDGSPGASSSNRVYPIRSNGVVETGRNPFPPFTGTPRAIDVDGSLYFEGSTRPDQKNPLLRLANGRQEVLAGAPVPETVEGQAPPFGVWNPRSGSLVYSSNLGTFSAVVQARVGQRPQVMVGGGTEISDAGGKKATDLTVYGIVAFGQDSDGRLVIGDTFRRRMLVVETDGQVSVLKDQAGAEIVYAPVGSLSSLQRIVVDNAGNIYWFLAGATPTGGVFEGEVAVWSKATKAVSTFPVRGIYHLTRLPDGSVAAIAGNASNYRRIYKVSPSGLGETLPGTAMLPYTSFTYWQDKPYFTAASRLFRGEYGRMELLDLPVLASGSNFTPDFVLAAGGNLIVHSALDGGFYRMENPSECRWLEQPRIETSGIVNAATGGNAGAISPRQLIRVAGTGLGPAGGQGFILDGAQRATTQAAPWPSLNLGNFSGAIEFNTLSGTGLPVLYSDDTQAVYQGITGTARTYLLYYTWQGIQIIHPDPIRMETATPGLFASGPAGEAYLAMADAADGARVTLEHPAVAGSVVRLIATGLGSMTDNLATGQFCGATPVATTNAVAVTIGGVAAELEFAGCYPATIAGTYQIRVRVPEELEPGLHSVGVRVGAVEMPAEPRMVLAVGRKD